MIEVGKFKSVYLVSRQDPWPDAARQRLDAIAGRQLPAALSRALAGFSAARSDRSIRMFRRLQLEVDLDLERDDDTLASLWAHQLLAAVARRIGEPTSDDAVHFSDEADLLRSFLNDAAAGHTGKWCYQRFEGLEHLSTTAKIRTAVCANAAAGLEALPRMTPRDLRLVLDALSENDARRIWDSFSTLLPGAGVTAGLRLLRETWEQEGSPAPDGAGEFRWALRMAVAALRGTASEARTWIAIARPLGRLLKLLRDLGRADRVFALDAIECNRPLDLHRVFDASDAAVIEPLLGCRRAVLEDFLDLRPAPSETPERRYTPFGGVFRLLPFLDALPVPRMIQAPSAFRFWILLKCLGAARAVRLFEDPVIRSLFELDPELSAEAFRRWQGGIGTRWLRVGRRLCLSSALVRDNSRHRAPSDRAYLRLPRLLSSSRCRDAWLEDMALLVVRSLAWRLPGFSTASLGRLFENFLDFPASVEDHEDRRAVRLGAPPLQLLLNMTGICRWRYAVSWLDGKRFELYPEAP